MSANKDANDLDRELIELLNELRVALPGVQVLFAFLLAVPFQQGWQRVTIVVTAATGGAFGWFWYALPLWRRVERG